MDFQMLLLKVGNALSTDDVKALTFLCTDLLDRNPTSVKSANDLFCRLAQRDHLTHERPELLTELLSTVQRLDLVNAHNLNHRDGTPPTTGLISPFRKLLYDLYEAMNAEDVRGVKFLLLSRLPRRKLEDNTSLLDVFLEMEHTGILDDTNLKELEEVVASVCPQLREQINQFKTQQEALQSSSLYTSDSLSSYLNCPESCQSSVVSSLASSESFLTSDTVNTESLANVTLQDDQTSSNSEALGIYPMTGKKRGICLIINNYRFTSQKTREGTMADADCLRDVFTWLGFDVEEHLNCTSETMLSLLRELGGRDHGQMDCVACCVLSHGLEGTVHGVDGRMVELGDLVEPLNALNCRTLAQKPKLFFIQACQGTKEQRAVHVEADGLCTDAVGESIPLDADFLVSMATVRSFVSYRDKQWGTWFIQSLCKNLVKMVPSSCDLLSILTKVNEEVSLKTDKDGVKKQMPQPSFTTRKKIVFPVPEGLPPSLPTPAD